MSERVYLSVDFPVTYTQRGRDKVRERRVIGACQVRKDSKRIEGREEGSEKDVGREEKVGGGKMEGKE